MALGLALWGLVERYHTVSLTSALLGLAIIPIALLPTLLWLRQPVAERPRFPLMALAGVYYALFYGLPVFFFGGLWDDYHQIIRFYGLTKSAHVDDRSMLAALVGVMLFVAAYIVLERRLAGAATRFSTSAEPDWRTIRWLCWALVLSLLTYRLVPIFSHLPSLGSFIVPAGNAGLAVFYVMWRRKILTLPEALALALLVMPVVAATSLSTGLLTQLGLLVVLWVALETWLSGRLPWRTLVALPLLFLLVYPLTNKIRNELWSGKGPETLIGKLAVIPRIATDYYGLTAKGEAFRFEPGRLSPFYGTYVRFSHEMVLARVVQTTPEPIPYWMGETYKPLISKLIPRVFWADKPREDKGNEFGRRYGFLPPNNYEMSINIPWMVELFANFGWLGLLGGMPLFGLLMAGLEAFFVSARGRELDCAIGAAIVCPLFYHESNFSLMIGNLPLLALALWIYFRFGQRLLARPPN